MAPHRGALIKIALIVLSIMLLLAIFMTPLISADLDSHQSPPENAGAETLIHNVTLLMADWSGNLVSKKSGELNVSIYDSNNNLVLSSKADNGRLDVGLREGLYTVIVRANGGTVGYQEIYVDKSKNITVKLRAYTLKITCVDREENYVCGAVILLYNLVNFSNGSSIDEVWRLIDLARTDKNGTALFHEVWNGTYKVVVESGRVIGEERLEVNEPKNITVKCGKTNLKIKVVIFTPTEHPLSNASVILQDSAGRLLRKGYTDEEGFIQFNNIYVDNYTVYVDWLDNEVFSGTIDAGSTGSLKIRASVFKVSLSITGLFGEPLPYSKIIVSKIISRRTVAIREMEADKNGFITFLLPSGMYEFSCESGIYSGRIQVNLFDNYSGMIRCDIHPNVWALFILLPLPLILLSLILERRKLKKPLEYRRYQSMLSKLESMYSNGLVEYKIYRKLKEEYETKLIELGGRKRR